MFELESLGIHRKASSALGKLKRSFDALKPTATTDGVPWQLVGGVPFGKEVTFFCSKDNAPVLRLLINPTNALQPPPNAAFRTLVKWFPDGSVKYLLIDFTDLVDPVEERESDSGWFGKDTL